MMGGERDYPMEALSVKRSSLTERLVERKARLAAELAQVSSALVALESNPELQTLFDIVSRVA
jgi:hypothetical protein